MKTNYDLHEKTELKEIFKTCMTNYIKAIKDEFSDENVYIIVFGTETQTMADEYTCLPSFNSEETFEKLKKSDSYKEYVEDEDEDESSWYFRINEQEWTYELDIENSDEIFKPVRDYLTDYFEKFVESLEDEDDFESWLVDKTICHAASFAFEELREEGILKNSQGKEMILKLLGFDRNFEEDEYTELFERVNKNVPLKDEFLKHIIFNEINI